MHSLLLGNPAGLWALLALPVVVVIHCLQQKAKRLRVSTLFLLEKVAPQSAEGSRIERFRQSVAFWMQIAVVLIATWMLAEPRWVRQESMQDVVVVLDTSASVGAVKSENRKALVRALDQWERIAGVTRWHLMTSQTRMPALYDGLDKQALLKAYDDWQPLAGSHDPAEALSTARGLLRSGAGGVIFVTDHAATMPAQVAVLSAGRALDNVGFSGVTVQSEGGRIKWSALVRCTGAGTQNREWRVLWKDDAGMETGTAPSSLTISPGKMLSLQGELPPSVQKAELVLTADDFALDDRVPLHEAKVRVTKIAMAVGGPVGDLMKRMISAVPDVELVGKDAEVTVAEIGSPTEGDAILVESPAPADAVLDAANVVAENHPLVRDLNWSGLMTTRPAQAISLAQDTPLLWRGSRPLAYQRQTISANGQPVTQLFLQWDLAKSNAGRLPATVVLLHRWIGERSRTRVAERTGNYEAGQRLEVPLPSGKTPSDLILAANGLTTPWTGSLPEKPGFFEIKLGTQRLVAGAAAFADAREGDFTQCGPADTTGDFVLEAAKRTTEADALSPVWMLAALGCLLTSWGWRKR